MRNRTLLLLLLVQAIYCKSQSAFQGIWEARIKAGVDLRIVFHFTLDSTGTFITTMDSPDQGIKGIKASSSNVNEDSVHVEFNQFQVKYSGKLISDSIIEGMFTQGASLPLNFKRINAVVEKRRPQTPVGPFPYAVKELVYYNKDKSISYGATITIPAGKGPFPAALLLTGSGQQNRDEEILEHKPFAVIADHLSRNGFVVLRVDDRGMGKTTGDVSSSTSNDFAGDAIISLNYLMSQPEVNKNKVGLIGHSEGAMIAQIIAAERNDINFVVILAGPGEKTTRLMEEQNEALLTSSGLPVASITSYLDLYKKVLDVLIHSDSNKIIPGIKETVHSWVAKTPPAIVSATTGITDEASANEFAIQFANQVNHPWFKYFLSYDPAVNIKKIRASVLALNGSKDIQVIPKTNLAGIEAALKTGHSKIYEVKELAGLNHLFQECNACSVNEYGQLEQTISPHVLDIITEWLKKSL